MSVCAIGEPIVNHEHIKRMRKGEYGRKDGFDIFPFRCYVGIMTIESLTGSGYLQNKQKSRGLTGSIFTARHAKWCTDSDFLP